MKKYSIALIISFALFAVPALAAYGLNSGVNVDINVNATATANKDKNDDESAVNNENSVSAEATEVRGWDDKSKQEFLTTVKTHAQLKSGQDLQNFAKGVMVKDENVAAVSTNDNDVEVHYKLPAKFLGVFGTDLSAIANVSFETDKNGRGPKDVTVKFPWYKMFFSLDSTVQADVLQKAIDASVQLKAQVPRDNVYAQNGATIQIISDVLKALRTEIEARSTTTASF